MSKSQLLALFVGLLLWSDAADLSAQCIVINEILINAAGDCDGGCSPSTSEFTELYNTCGTPVNIGCYVMSDGDFSVTIPANTVIPAYGFFVIGSANSPVPAEVDLNLATCNCVSGTNIGVYTNGNEQVVLYSNTGVLEDGIYWGSGQFPANVNGPSTAGCTGLTTTVSNGNALSLLPTGGADGCTMARSCDGSEEWQQRCGNTVSMGQSNGEPDFPDFASSGASICPNTCIDFTDETSSTVFEWNWTFEGAIPSTSSVQNPTSICYNTPGSYDVTLSVNGNCGTFDFTLENAIQVAPTNEPPVLSPAGPLVLCNGSTIQLQLLDMEGLPINWFRNGVLIPSDNSNLFTATQSGTYTAQVIQNTCAAFSNEVVITFQNDLEPSIIALNGTVACEGESVLLSTQTGFETYQWYWNGAIVLGQTTATLAAEFAGEYSIEVTQGSCSGVSDVTDVIIQPLPTAGFNSTGPVTICENTAFNLQALGGFDSYQWFFNGALLPGETGTALAIEETGSYSVEVTLNNCSSISAPFQVIVSEVPDLSVNPSPTIWICEGEQTEITASAGFNVYQWFSSSTPIAGANSSTLSVNSAGSFSVTATTIAGCEAGSNAVDVNVESLLFPELISSDNPLCEGDEALISISAAGDVTWFLNALPLANTSPTLSVTAEGNYTAVVSHNGCVENTPPLSLTVLPAPTVDISALTDLIHCDDESTILEASGSGSFNWFRNGTALSTATANPLTTSTEGTYTVQLTDVFGCVALSNPIEVVYAEISSLEIVGPTIPPCEGSSLSLSLNQNFQSVLWSTGAVSNSISVNEPGAISVEVSNEWNCTASATFDAFFATLPVVTLPSAYVSDCSKGVQLMATVSEGSIAWSPSATLSAADVEQPVANPTTTTSYTIIVTNGACEVIRSTSVEADCGAIYVPNSFTPNGDGVNDLFRVVTNGAREFELLIFNRWGEVVFETTDPQAYWDGGLNGYYAQDGVYTWLAKAFDAEGKNMFDSLVKTGTVLLMR